MSKNISSKVLKHIFAVLKEIEDAIQNCPEDLWIRDEEKEDFMKKPAILAYHTVWCISLSHLLDLKQIPIERFPPRPNPPVQKKTLILEMVKWMKDAIKDKYQDMEDEVFLSSLDQYIYAIAHTRHHYGQFLQILKEQDIIRPKWYK